MKGPAVEELQQACRDGGLRVTRQRVTILEALESRSDHPTADQVYERARVALPDLSRTTVYRTLDRLVQAGVARSVCHPGATVRYELALVPHHHLVCLGCNRLIDVVAPELDAIRLPSTRKHGFKVEYHTVQMKGTCADCRRGSGTTRHR
jgi:Fur family peroxide stress response transcriptional regulator